MPITLGLLLDTSTCIPTSPPSVYVRCKANPAYHFGGPTLHPFCPIPIFFPIPFRILYTLCFHCSTLALPYYFLIFSLVLSIYFPPSHA